MNSVRESTRCFEFRTEARDSGGVAMSAARWGARVMTNVEARACDGQIGFRETEKDERRRQLPPALEMVARDWRRAYVDARADAERRAPKARRVQIRSRCARLSRPRAAAGVGILGVLIYPPRRQTSPEPASAPSLQRP